MDTGIISCPMHSPWRGHLGASWCGGHWGVLPSHCQALIDSVWCWFPQWGEEQVGVGLVRGWGSSGGIRDGDLGQLTVQEARAVQGFPSRGCETGEIQAGWTLDCGREEEMRGCNRHQPLCQHSASNVSHLSVT